MKNKDHSSVASGNDVNNPAKPIYFIEMDYEKETKWENGKKWERKRQKPKSNKEWGPWSDWYVVYCPPVPFDCPRCGAPVVAEYTGKWKYSGNTTTRQMLILYVCTDPYCGWSKVDTGELFSTAEVVPCANDLGIGFRQGEVKDISDTEAYMGGNTSSLVDTEEYILPNGIVVSKPNRWK